MDKAKTRVGLEPTCGVVSCYEAGRDGFWIHRELVAAGVENLVVDSASIEVDRRRRRAKTDRLDARRLLAQLERFHGGEQGALHVVVVPSMADEDARRRHRELERMRRERTAHSNRIRSLLVLHGIRLVVSRRFPAELDGRQVPVHLKAELLREYERWHLVDQQLRGVEAERRKELTAHAKRLAEHREDLKQAAGPGLSEAQRCQLAEEILGRRVRITLQLSSLQGIAFTGAEVLTCEVFWRDFANRRQVGAAIGLAPTPFASGGRGEEQGISKAGNKRARRVLLELAWCWVRYQPDSQLTQWFLRRFGGSARLRRIGIVALARRLLIELWRYVQTGVIPEGARLKSVA